MADFPQCREPCVTKTPQKAGRSSSQAEPGNCTRARRTQLQVRTTIALLPRKPTKAGPMPILTTKGCTEKIAWYVGPPRKGGRRRPWEEAPPTYKLRVQRTQQRVRQQPSYTRPRKLFKVGPKFTRKKKPARSRRCGTTGLREWKFGVLRGWRDATIFLVFPTKIRESPFFLQRGEELPCLKQHNKNQATQLAPFASPRSTNIRTLVQYDQQS